MPDAQQFPIGLAGEASVQVTSEVSTSHLGEETTVFSTPELVRLMERASIRALEPYVQPGQHSVGVAINIRHLAATPLGATVTARAELLAVDGRRLTFRVSASDGVDTVGEGDHERAVIDVARFAAKAAEKQARLSSAAG